MLQGKTNSEVLKSIQNQLNKFLYPQTARKAQRKVHFTNKYYCYTYSSEDGLFLIVSRICLIKDTQFCESHISKLCFCRCFCFIQSNKILLLKIIVERVAPCFSLVSSQLELTVFVYERKLCS